MTELDLTKEICVRTFGFSVPCRRFVLAAKITRDRRMPLVDEFVLRALKITGELTMARLSGFFGFSPLEIQTVVSDLANRSLVTVHGENVQLHPAAREMFRTSDGTPTILDVESWVEIVWFDLISGNLINRKIRQSKHLVELQPRGARVSVAVDFARAAFEENFRDYLRRIRNINNPDLYNLYAVTDVQPSQYGFVAVEGSEDLQFRPEPKLMPSLLEGEGALTPSLRKLNEAIRDAYEELSHPEPSVAARDEYSRLTQSTTLQSSVRANGYIDLERWLREERGVQDSGTETLVGAMYIDRNRQGVRKLIEAKLDADPNAATVTPELFWIRPGGSSWGASDDLRAMLAEMRAVGRPVRERHGALRTTLVVPASERASHPRRFNRLFDRGLLAPAGYLTPALEIILLRGLAAVVLVWVPLAESCEVWIGRATTRAQDLSALEQRLDLPRLQTEAQRLWPHPGLRNAPLIPEGTSPT